MASNVIPFPVRAVTTRNYLRQPYTTPDREHALAHINEARAFLQTAIVGSWGWEQATWLLECWTEKLAIIDHANDNIIPLRRA